MKLCVIHPRASYKSATKLANALQCDIFNPFKAKKLNFLDYDLVFNYGVSLPVKAKYIVNPPWAVEHCVSKTYTYQVLKASKVPTINFVRFKAEVPKSWENIVCRESETDHSNKGMSIVAKGDALPDAAFYAEYFEHKFEFRIVVFKNKVIARYLKRENKQGEWEFESLDKAGFEKIDEASVTAAQALGINFVGFDVLANSQQDFRVLEANSGPIMTPEVLKVLKKEFSYA